MTVKYAAGKRAFAFCDNCNFRYDLADLKPQIIKGNPTNLMVCDECNDEDHPQYFIGMVPINDPQALRNPRPDTALDESRVLWGWNPVGNNAVYAAAMLGTITVETNE